MNKIVVILGMLLVFCILVGCSGSKNEESTNSKKDAMDTIAAVDGYSTEDGIAVKKILQHLKENEKITNDEVITAERKEVETQDVVGETTKNEVLYITTSDGTGYYILVSGGKVYAVYKGNVSNNALVYYIVM